MSKCYKCKGEIGRQNKDDGSVQLRCIECNAFNGEERDGSLVMPFGKYKSRTLHDILKIDRQYLEWARENMKEDIAVPIGQLLDAGKDIAC